MPSQNKNMHVLAVSHAKRLFLDGDKEQERAKAYAARLASYQVIVFTRASEGFKKSTLDKNITIYPTNSRNRLFMLFDAYRIGKSILAEGSNKRYVVTSQNPFESSLVGMLLARTQNAIHHVQIHEDVFSRNSWRSESVLNRLRYVFGRFVVRRAKCIRVVSGRIKRSLTGLGVKEEQITVLPIYSELDAFLRFERNREEHEQVTILAAGRLSHEKNFGLIVRAVAELVKKYPHIVLRIVGSGPEGSKLKQQVQRLELEQVVTFVPWVPSLVSEMQNADIFAVSSDHEGYSLVLVEAMAAALPIVTTDVGCVGDVVLHKQHALVVPPGDLAAFTAMLRKLIEDGALRTQLGSAGRETAGQIATTGRDAYIDAWVASLSACE